MMSVTLAKQIYDDEKFTATRLPTYVKPIHYDICLKPDTIRFNFTGTVKIDYQSSGPDSNSLVLHATELEIINGSIIGENLEPNQLDTVIYSDKSETATLEFRNSIISKGTLTLEFKGILNDKLRGFYRVAYELDGCEVYAASTQFAPVDTRRCFPCWDEPAIKSSFTVSLIIPKYVASKDGVLHDNLAVSNMPEIDRQSVPDALGRTVVGTCDEEIKLKFDKSPIMSTYLVAFVVGPLQFIECSDTRRSIRIYTLPHKKEQGKFALDVACKCLPFYEDYFGIEYPLKKMDLVALPDFSYGAMENWGLVMFRENCLLVDEKNSSTNSKQNIALIVAHELAHQWFGNLVTMEWWTHLWLNEGFATFMEFLCVAQILPEYDIWSQFLTEIYVRALDLDALHSSHPIEVPVKSSGAISEIFDAISYCKGASVIRMLYDYIGDKSFRIGMKDYLSKFAYGNTVTEDLWDALETASGKPVGRLMAGWTLKKGFPWISVSLSESGPNKLRLSLTQCKFSADGELAESDYDTLWMIPINAITAKDPSNPKEVCLLPDKMIEVTIDCATDSWIKLNPASIGLYRTAYTTGMLQRLHHAIVNQELPPMDRLGLHSDFAALCRAGKISLVDLLKLMQAFKKETSYPVWCCISRCVDELRIILSGTSDMRKFSAYCLQLFTDAFKRLTWSPQQNEGHMDRLSRSLILDKLIIFGARDVVNEAKDRFYAHLNDQNSIPADLREACYKAVAMYGTVRDFNNLMELYRTTTLHEEKNRIGLALGCTRDSDCLKRVVDFTMSDEVRNQDKSGLIGSIGRNDPQTAWGLLKDNIDKLLKSFEGGILISRIISVATQNLSSVVDALDVAEFFEKHQVAGAERTIKQSLETIRLNAKWLKNNEETLREFLAEYSPQETQY